MIITACTANEPYFSHAKVLLASLAENMPQMSIGLYLINGASSQCDELQAVNKKAYPVTIRCDANDKDYSNTIRGKLILEYIETGSPAIWMDTDCIVRGEIDGLFMDYYIPTLKIMYRGEGVKERVRFQNGVFAVNSTPETIELFEKFTDKMQGDKSWYQDQLWLYRLWKERESKIDLISLGAKYNDWHFNDDSIIWHCKSSHFEEAKYQKEYQHYLGIANEKIGSVLG